MTVLFEPILALHKIILIKSIFQVDELPPPQIFSLGGGGGDCSPAPPGSTLSGGKRLGRARGDVYSGGSRICKKRGGRKKSVRIAHRVCAKRAPHTGGVQGPAVGPLAGCRGKAPAGGPGGGAPGSSRVFSK